MNDTFRPLISGIDSLYLSFDVDPRPSAIDFAELDYLKQLLRDDPKRSVHRMTLGGLELGLLPSGQFPYAHVFEHPHFTLKLAERMSPALFVEFRSEALWHFGSVALVQSVRDWCGALGMTPLGPDRVSRVDVAFDTHLPVMDFCLDHFVTRLRRDKRFRRSGQVQTMHLGSGDLQLRVYDKSAEIVEASSKTWFHPLWGIKDDVWRIEWQLRREALKERGIDSFHDLGARLSGVLVSLASDHTSLRQPCDDQNRSRWPLHLLWRNLIERSRSFAGFDIETPQERWPDSLAVVHERSALAILGYLKRFAAEASLLEGGDHILSTDDALALLLRRANDNCPGPLWDADVRAKMDALEVKR
ncbi:hypothetical protein HK107_06565 [Parvularcula sp. ZS-1/3]|uniref:Replication initiation factor n=1 Tax=Parvularcula mediterranea TaxID=2732508 RepID=A0A7Y3W583_9PROT|nr:hypothetical protein [Parvularcula mediterranea]NNU15981.1 hypothetical protein [Parvularcula mediterranea]